MSDKSPRYGATRLEWAHFDSYLGLTEDLLPVVSNPQAAVADSSRMKDVGKTPSIYNKQKLVVGLSAWTQRKTEEADIERWMAQPDYGMCLQNRTARAIDNDIPDAILSAKVNAVIENYFMKTLGVTPPKRVRGNSSKCLFLFTVRGNMPKRVIRVKEKQVDENGKTIAPAWIIEHLANGQQCLIAGTHVSGFRYEWEGGLPRVLPELTLEQFNELWKLLEINFACAPSMTAGIRKRGEYVETDDAIANMIIGRGLDLGMGNDGQLFIECPWKGDHSMDSGTTECAYFPRGTGGYELGHFVCMHSSCKSKYDDTDFEEKLGLRDDMFQVEEVDATDDKGEKVQPLPAWLRLKNGDVLANLYNLRLALERFDIIGRVIKYDRFTDDDMIKMPGDKKWRPLTDGDIVNLREHLEKHQKFKPIGRELMRDAIIAHGERNSFDSAIDWLESLPGWDGIKRIDKFIVKYFGAEDTEYARAVSRYLWSAIAGRIMTPGAKADMAVILQGDQGVVKSTGIAALVPYHMWFAEISLNDKEGDLARRLRGKIVVELGELRGFYSKEFEAIKAWIVRRFDQWVPKYRERTITFPRRCVLIGTTNHADFLIDETGNRRFLPIRVERADLTAITKDLMQLYAEARDLYLAEGICWREAENLAKNEHEKFTVHDSWEDDIATWLELGDLNKDKPSQREYLRISDVLREALNIDSRTAHNGLEKRAAKVLKSLGYVGKKMKIEGRSLRVYVKA